MSNSYQFTYKCRMCGLIFGGESGYTDPDKFMRYAIERLMVHQGVGFTGLMITHHCENGNVGIADLIGAQKEYQ